MVVVGERTEELRPGQQISRTTSTIPPTLGPFPHSSPGSPQRWRPGSLEEAASWRAALPFAFPRSRIWGQG